jgi:hypothetical protein
MTAGRNAQACWPNRLCRLVVAFYFSRRFYGAVGGRDRKFGMHLISNHLSPFQSERSTSY